MAAGNVGKNWFLNTIGKLSGERKLKIRKEPSATAARERWEPYWQYVGNQVPRPGGPSTNHEPGKNIKTYFFLNI